MKAFVGGAFGRRGKSSRGREGESIIAAAKGGNRARGYGSGSVRTKKTICHSK